MKQPSLNVNGDDDDYKDDDDNLRLKSLRKIKQGIQLTYVKQFTKWAT